MVLAVIFGFDLSLLLFPLSMLALGAMFISGRGGLAGRFSPARLGGGEESTVPAVTFSQVGGQEMAKRELLEALTFLKESSRTRQLGIRPLKGVLLVGPPGTGKTLMAKAAANYTASVFLAASGSQFIQMYAGVECQPGTSAFQGPYTGTTGEEGQCHYLHRWDRRLRAKTGEERQPSGV